MRSTLKRMPDHQGVSRHTRERHRSEVPVRRATATLANLDQEASLSVDTQKSPPYAV